MQSVGRKLKRNHFLLAVLLFVAAFFAVRMYTRDSRAQENLSNPPQREVTLVDNGLTYETATSAGTVGDFITEQKINLGDHDAVYPGKDQKLFSGSKIIIQRAKKITVTEGGSTRDYYTFQNTVEQALWENKVPLGSDDFTVPARTTPVAEGEKIAVTHVQISEETKNVPIPFNTVTNQDNNLGWRIKKITQAGVPGVNEIEYKVVTYDGKEISRTVLQTTKVQDPVSQVVTQGTYVKVGKTYSGAASWYSFTGTLAAANPWLPMGSYARVTNMDNGKSVIVVINDRGPFGNGRIIDLDKVAFEQIANIGAGVANVKVEAIVN